MAALHPPDHADGCACDQCMPGDPMPEPIRVGFPGIIGPFNGTASACASDGEVWVAVHGFGIGQLSMPKAEATALRDQLNNAINSL